MKWSKLVNLLKFFIYGFPIFVLIMSFILNNNVIISGQTPNLMTIVNNFITSNINLFKVPFIFDLFNDIYELIGFGTMPTYLQWANAYASYLVLVHLGYILIEFILFVPHVVESWFERGFKL